MNRITPIMLAMLLAAGGVARAVPLACSPAGTSCERAPVGYEPAYPAGTGYNAFIGPALGGYVPDDDGDGAYNDERCSNDREAGLAEVSATLGILVALGTVCEALPSGPDIACVTPPVVPAMGPQEFCTAALALPAIGLETSALFITRCDLQDRFVDGAEVEAAYENSKLMLSRDLEQQLRECNPLVGLFLPRQYGGRLEEVQAFVALRLRAFEQMDAESTADLSFDLARARTWYERGNDHVSGGEYKDAYGEYCRAYRELRNVSP